MLSYLIPTNFFEWLFFIIIFGSTIIIGYLVRRYANPRAWEENWQSGTLKGGNVCKKCKGSGKISKKCSECHGKGKIEFECSVCHGYGEINGKRCAFCNGKGTLADAQTCTKCNGTGTLFNTCPDCQGKRIIHDENPEKDDLHREHGSVFELSDHVMTASEKCADVLPSTLLVVGLLGTFLGIGMALNDAAGSIASISTDKISADSMTGLVNNMRGMIEGMGGQFKSSIYGIIASLLFTFWRSKFGSEKDRVRWAITKCNEENNKNSNNTNIKEMSESLNKIRVSIGDSLKKTIHEDYEERNANLAELIRNAANPSFEVIDSARQLANTLAQTKESTDRVAKAIEKNLKDTAKAAKDMGEKSKDFNQAIGDCIPELTRASKQLSQGFDKLESGIAKRQDNLHSMLQNAEDKKFEEAKKVNEAFAEKLTSLANTNQGLAEKLESLVNHLADQQDKLFTMMQNAESMKIQIVQQTNKAFDEKLTNLANSNQGLAEKLESLVKANQQDKLFTMMRNAESMKIQIAQQTNKAFDEKLTNLANTNQELTKKLDSLINHLSERQDKLFAMIQNAERVRSKAPQATLTNAISSVTKAINASQASPKSDE